MDGRASTVRSAPARRSLVCWLSTAWSAIRLASPASVSATTDPPNPPPVIRTPFQPRGVDIPGPARPATRTPTLPPHLAVYVATRRNKSQHPPSRRRLNASDCGEHAIVLGEARTRRGDSGARAASESAPHQRRCDGGASRNARRCPGLTALPGVGWARCIGRPHAGAISPSG